MFGGITTLVPAKRQPAWADVARVVVHRPSNTLASAVALAIGRAVEHVDQRESAEQTAGGVARVERSLRVAVRCAILRRAVGDENRGRRVVGERRHLENFDVAFAVRSSDDPRRRRVSES
jgi:hypothetical protein